MEQLIAGMSEMAAERWFTACTGKLRRYWKQRGAFATLLFLASRLFRREIHIVYQASPGSAGDTVQLERDEQILQIGPENLDTILTPELRAFLGGGEAFDNLEGVRNGDRLFVIMAADEYLHRGYIMFSCRANKMLGDSEKRPIIGYCKTAPGARGRGLYRRALAAEKAYLWNHGYTSVLIETDPENYASRRGIEGSGFSFAWTVHVWIFFNCLVVRCLRNGIRSRWRVLWV